MIGFIEERGWMVFNGKVKGDEQGEYTFTGGRGGTAIDYVLGDKEVKDRIERMRVGDRTDHQPMEVWIRGEWERRGGRGAKERGWRGVWMRQGGKNLERGWER